MASNDKKKKLTKKAQIEKNNKIIKVTLLCIALVVVFVSCFLLAGGYFSKERKVNKSIVRLGEKFYTGFYYNKISQNQSSKAKEKFLKQFKDTGIIVSLYNLEKYSSNGNEDNLKILEKYKCDKYKTTVTIYPKSPYKENSFEMKAKIDCDSLK